MNGEGKMQYSHTVPNYIQKVITRFNTRGKEYINKIYRKDPSYNNSYILNEVEQGQKLNVIVGDNVQLQNDSQGTRFKGYNANHYDTAAINMYINQPKKTKVNPRAFYQMPITSDAPINYYLESNKMGVKEA